MKEEKRKAFSILSKLIFCSSVIVLAFAVWALLNDIKNNKKAQIVQVNDPAEMVTKESHIEFIKFLGKKIPPFTLPLISSENVYDFPSSMRSKYILLVFFTPLDCPSCFTEIPFWNQLRNYQQNFQIIGIVAYDNVIAAKKFIEQSGIQIPALFDSAATYSTQIELSKIGGTPLKILVNSERHILHIKSSTYDQPDLQKRYLENILNITG